MPAIAQASARLAAMNIGGEDFALENGMEPTEETLLMPKQQMVFAARSAGIMPLGFIASVASFGDWDVFARMVRRSRQFGFMGAGCIHPGQVPIGNRDIPVAEEALARRGIGEQKPKPRRASFAIAARDDGPVSNAPRPIVRLRRSSARVKKNPFGVKIFSYG